MGKEKIDLVTDKKESLTKREHEIINLLSKGMTREEIATKLFVSPETIKKHLQNIYKKLDAKNKIEALNKNETAINNEIWFYYNKRIKTFVPGTERRFDKKVFFIHGNSGSSATWTHQLNSSLFQNYHLIAFDLPAHGLSDSSSDPDIDYSPIIMGKMMAEAVSPLAADKPYILIGFSFGTNIIGEMLADNLKPAGIILVSSCILRSVTDLQNIFLPNPNANNFFKDSLSSEDLTDLALDCFYLRNDPELEKFKSDFKNTKAAFRSTLMKKASEGAVSDEIELLIKTNLPVLTVFGKEDKIVNANYLDIIPIKAWRETIYKLTSAGHFVHIDQAERFNQLATNYINEMFRGSRA